MNVYPTQRSASYPQYVYDATKEIAGKAELVQGGNGIINAAIGIPFPIPANGLEADLERAHRTVSRCGGHAVTVARLHLQRQALIL